MEGWMPLNHLALYKKNNSIPNEIRDHLLTFNLFFFFKNLYLQLELKQNNL